MNNGMCNQIWCVCIEVNMNCRAREVLISFGTAYCGRYYGFWNGNIARGKRSGFFACHSKILTRNKAKKANWNADANNTTSYELVHTCGNMDVIWLNRGRVIGERTTLDGFNLCNPSNSFKWLSGVLFTLNLQLITDCTQITHGGGMRA